MDHLKILKRAFHITLDYRALWVFGILLALTVGGGGNGGGGNQANFNTNNRGENLPNFPEMRLPHIPSELISVLITVGILLACMLLIWMVVGTILRYVSETSLIRMVNQHEASGEKPGVRQGFRMGWNRAAWRIFLIDLLFGLGGFLIFLLLLLIAAAPLLVWLTENQVARVIGTVVAVGLGSLWLLTAILVGIALALLTQFFRRACVLEEMGVAEAIRRGVALVRQRLGDVVLMGILLFAIGLAWVVVMIPVAIVLVLAGVILGGLPALLVGWIASQFAQGATPWMIAGAIGIPVFMLVLGIPMLFLNGLKQVFDSSTWTLLYRELLALETIQPAAPSLAAKPEEAPVD